MIRGTVSFYKCCAFLLLRDNLSVRKGGVCAFLRSNQNYFPVFEVVLGYILHSLGKIPEQVMCFSLVFGMFAILYEKNGS